MPDASATAGDSLALAESQRLANEKDLERLEKQNAHSRRESFRAHYHRGVLAFFWAFVLVLMAAGFCWAWHLLTPAPCHFLTAVQLDKIQSTFLSGVISAALSAAVKERYFGSA